MGAVSTVNLSLLASRPFTWIPWIPYMDCFGKVIRKWARDGHQPNMIVTAFEQFPSTPRYGKRDCSKFGPAIHLPRFAILYFKIQYVNFLL